MCCAYSPELSANRQQTAPIRFFSVYLFLLQKRPTSSTPSFRRCSRRSLLTAFLLCICATLRLQLVEKKDQNFQPPIGKSNSMNVSAWRFWEAVYHSGLISFRKASPEIPGQPSYTNFRNICATSNKTGRAASFNLWCYFSAIYWWVWYIRRTRNKFM